MDFAGALVGFLLTCMVLSYIFGDNPLFRFTIYLFIGVAAGYAGAVALRNVILPNLIYPLFKLASGDYSIGVILAVIPFGLSLLMLAKLSSRIGRIGNPVMAFLVGVGAAVAIGGAISGTLLPLITASTNLFDLTTLPGDNPASVLLTIIGRIISIVATLTTLIYFHYGTRQGDGTQAQRSPWIEGIAGVGQVFIAITFGIVFDGVYAASLTALIERINALIDYFFAFLSFFGF